MHECKRYEISKDETLIYDVNDESCLSYMISIYDYVGKGKNVKKKFTLSKWDDYGFSAYSREKNTKIIDFSFSIDHPLYYPFYKLLNGNDNLIIRDDESNDEKYLEIKLLDDMIYLIFHGNDINIYQIQRERFYIFIKNIGYDIRSREENNEIKTRLNEFFKDVQLLLDDNYHQITMDEYLVKKKIKNK